MLYPLRLFRRLQTSIDKHGTLSKRDSALAVKAVQSSEVQRSEYHESDNDDVECEVGAKTAGVSWCFIGRVE